MATKSNLEILGLSGIFQGIADNKRSGILYAKSENHEKYIYFREGNVQMVASPNHPSILAEALRRAFGQIDDQTLESIFQTQGETGKSLYSILLEMQAEEQFIVDLCRYQIGEEIFELFIWPDIQFEFSEEDPHPDLFRQDLLDLPINLNPGVLLMEAARRLDEWQAIVTKFSSMKDIPYISQDIYEDQCAPEEIHLLSYTDGGSDFEEILATCRLPKFQAMGIFYKMLGKGLISLKTSTELKEMASFEEFRENIAKCIKLYERSEDLGAKDIETIKWLAEAYESYGQISKAVAKYKELGDACLKREDMESAIKAFERVITYAPEELEAHAKYVQTLFQNGQFQEGASAAIIYAQKVAVEEPSKAIEVLEDAYQNNPLSPEILEYMAQLQQDQQNNVESIFTYTNLANLYKTRGLFDETVNVYQKILAIDEANIEARIELANTFLLMGNHEEGVLEYKRLGDILYVSGLIKEKFGFTFLINVCEKILQFEPTNLSAREWLADAYLFHREFAKAKKHLIELLEFLQGEDQPEALLSVLQKLVGIDPENRNYHRMLAQIYHRLEQVEEAAEELITIGDLAIKDGSTFLQEGKREEGIQTFLESLDALNLVLVIDPFNLEVREKRAELLHELGRVDEAVEEYKLICNMTKAVQRYHEALTALFHIVELAPDQEISAFLELARICEKQQKVDLAVNFYKKYAWHSLRRGDFGEALIACRRVLALNSEDKEVEKWRDTALQFVKIS